MKPSLEYMLFCRSIMLPREGQLGDWFLMFESDREPGLDSIQQARPRSKDGSGGYFTVPSNFADTTYVWLPGFEDWIELLAPRVSDGSFSDERDRKPAAMSDVLLAISTYVDRVHQPDLLMAAAAVWRTWTRGEAGSLAAFEPGRAVRATRSFPEPRRPCPRVGTVGTVKAAANGWVHVLFEDFEDATEPGVLCSSCTSRYRADELELQA